MFGVRQVRDQQLVGVPHLNQDAGVRVVRIQVCRQPADGAAEQIGLPGQPCGAPISEGRER